MKILKVVVDELPESCIKCILSDIEEVVDDNSPIELECNVLGIRVDGDSIHEDCPLDDGVIRVGDTVRVIDAGKKFNSYDDFFIENKAPADMLKKYRASKVSDVGYKSGKVVFIGEHRGKGLRERYGKLYVLEITDQEVILIGSKGIEKF